jgi:hypothetical protein
MALLALKLVATPLLIAAATLTARRFGAGVGGWLAGLPLTSGPVSAFFAVEQGPAFAARAAVGTLLGLVAVTAFCVAYARVAGSGSWPLGTLAGLGAFAATAGLLAGLPLTLAPALVVTFAALAAGALLIATSGRPAYVGAPRWDLPLRIATATAVVVLVTAVAPALGPRWSGVLSTVPVFAGTMAAFSHRLAGPRAAAQLLRGVVIGSFAFAAFFLVVGVAVERLGLTPTYALATGVALAVNAGALGLVERPPARAPLVSEPGASPRR